MSPSTGPMGGLNCEVKLYFNWSYRWSQSHGSTVIGPIGGLNCEVLQ